MNQFFIKSLILLAFVCTTINTLAQGFEIIGIEKLPTDMDARVTHARKDQNGKTCAIIKIATPLTGFSFDTGTLAVQYVVEKTGETWVYVQPGVKKITIAHKTLGVVREWEFPIKIEEACSYALSINIFENNIGEKNNDNLKVIDNNLQRTVLYSLKKNESLYAQECILSLKSDGSHFSCIIQDDSLKEKFLIVDGIKKIAANYIYTLFIDASDYSNCVYVYWNGNYVSAYIKGKRFGPYYESSNGYYYGYGYLWDDDNPSWLNRNDNTSSILSDAESLSKYMCGQPLINKYKAYTDYQSYDLTFKSDTVVSPNNKHKAFSLKFGSIVVNKLKIRILPAQQTFDKTWSQRIAILDDGRCVVKYYCRNFPNRIFVITGKNIKELTQDEFFNYRTQTIDNKKDTRFFNGYVWQEPYEYQFCYSNQTRIINDVSGKHSLETNNLYDYVLIDNREYGNESALGIWYFEEVNSFAWTALEGNELVMYRYQL